MSAKLRACPFCVVVPGDGSMVLHPNNKCRLNGVVMTIKEWNTRPAEEALLKVLEDLVDATPARPLDKSYYPLKAAEARLKEHGR